MAFLPVANVVHRKTRTGVAVLAVALSMATVMLLESGLICAAGVAAGVGLAFVGRYGLGLLYPSEQVAFSLRLAGNAATIGLLGGGFGAAYPALRAPRLDPIRALNSD